MNIDISEPSICIPRVFMNIDVSRIKNVFGELFGINNIKQIDVIKNFDKRDKPYNKVFVHFNSWPIEHIETRNKLLEGKEIKIVYEQPWFWKCSASRINKHKNPPPYILNEGGRNNFIMPPVSLIYNNNVSSIGSDVKTIKWKNNVKKEKSSNKRILLNSDETKY